MNELISTFQLKCINVDIILKIHLIFILYSNKDSNRRKLNFIIIYSEFKNISYNFENYVSFAIYVNIKILYQFYSD